MTGLKRAKEQLESNGYTCVLSDGEREFFSLERGVKPLVVWLDLGEDFSQFYAADKVVGKATAFLYVLLKIKGVYARVISKSAIQVLKERSIYVEYDIEVEHIINRKGDGICPFEKAVLEETNPQKAYGIIKSKIEEMKK